MVVVPEQFTHEAERRILKEYGSISKFGIDVLSFERIGARVFAESGMKRTEHLTAVGKGVTVSKKFLSDTELVYYKNSAQNPGFAELCADTLSEFKKIRNFARAVKICLREGAKTAFLKAKTEDFYRLFVRIRTRSAKNTPTRTIFWK
ncbi:MAG: hypothetical protein L6V93_07550 [Clostridiales bacterium]|nr:MAG: hypothetical protein L6V93_07550 [Clostridiales bacterium]